MMPSAAVIKSELSDEKPHFCAKCEQLIRDRYFLRALNLFWHEDCLKCQCCNCRLGDVGATLYTRENFLLCKSDYMRLYGNTGLCAACHKLIPAFEMVMRARRNVYHLECFACQQCTHRFCVGDRFYLYENRILCESDYAEKVQLAAVAAAAAAAASATAVTTAETSTATNNNSNVRHLHGQQQQQQQHKTPQTGANFNVKSFPEFSVFGLRSGGSGGSALPTGVDHHVVVR